MHFLRFVFFALLSFPLLAQEIQYTSSWRAFLTGAESTVKLQCPGDEVSLEIHYEHRRLASVTQRVDGEETTLTFTLPEMKAGVRLPAELRIEARSKGKAIATLRQPIGLYSPAPLAQRVTWAESLQIRLLDPDSDSAGALDSIALPSTRFTNSRGLLDEPGLIILAEGLNLDVYRYLTKDLIAACQQGRQVLCLSPSDGKWPLAGLADAPELPTAIDFRGPEHLRDLHKDCCSDAPFAATGLLRDRRASELWRVHADSASCHIGTNPPFPVNFSSASSANSNHSENPHEIPNLALPAFLPELPSRRRLSGSNPSFC
jgi:hypothetical protein